MFLFDRLLVFGLSVSDYISMEVDLIFIETTLLGAVEVHDLMVNDVPFILSSLGSLRPWAIELKSFIVFLQGFVEMVIGLQVIFPLLIIDCNVLILQMRESFLLFFWLLVEPLVNVEFRPAVFVFQFRLGVAFPLVAHIQ